MSEEPSVIPAEPFPFNFTVSPEVAAELQNRGLGNLRIQVSGPVIGSASALPPSLLPQPVQCESVELKVRLKDGRVVKWTAQEPQYVEVETHAGSLLPPFVPADFFYGLVNPGFLDYTPSGASIRFTGGMPYSVQVQAYNESAQDQ